MGQIDPGCAAHPGTMQEVEGNTEELEAGGHCDDEVQWEH